MNGRPRACFATGLPVCLVLVAGCSREYNAERLYWHAERAALAASKNPAKASEQEVAAAIAGFERVITQAPGTLPAVRAQFAIGSLHALRRDFPKARAAYTRVLRNYGQFTEFNYAARVAIAKCFEAENNRESLLKTYEEIGQQHPWTPLGLEAPLMIGASEAQRGAKEKAQAAYKAAAEHYEGMINRAPSAALAARAKAQLSVAYQRLEQWDKAAATLKELSQRKEPGVNRAMVLLVMAGIYESKLQDAEEARKIYAQLAEEFPALPEGKAAAKRLAVTSPPAGARNTSQ